MVINPFRIQVTPEQSIIVQKFLFSNNYEWFDSGTKIQHLELPYLFIGIKYLTHSNNNSTFSTHRFPELTYQDIIKVLRTDKLKKLNEII